MTADIVPHGYYVYTHHRATTGEIFYVGMGHERRAWRTNARSKYWKAIAAKHGHTVTIVESGLQRWAAAELEQNLIALHGRKDLGLGPLVNFSDGGEAGAFGVVRSKETREKLSADKKAFYANNLAAKEKAREKAKAQYADPTARQRMRELSLKLWSDPAHKANISAKASLQMKKFVASPEGQTRLEKQKLKQMKAIVCNETLQFESLTEAAQWLKTRPRAIPKASKSGISYACRSGAKTYGYTWRYLDPARPL